MLQALADSLLSIVYPQVCRVCKHGVEKHFDGVACSACWDATTIFNGSETLCSKCGAFLDPFGGPAETLCQTCGDHAYDTAAAVGIYEKALVASILHLKKEPFVSKRLRNLLLRSFQNGGLVASTVVIPVPLSRKRLHERGFNQAEVIGRILAKEFGVRLDSASLARTTHTPVHRAAMDRKAREATVSKAFEVVRPKLVEGERILLVDDVLTSGSTASQCAAVLKKNGAEWVGVLTLARAV
jgi:competence protein ComFC